MPQKKLIKVKVIPDSSKEEITQKKQDSLEIKLRAKPQGGEANRALLTLLAKFLNLKKERIRIIKGFHRRNKIIEIDYP